MRRLNEELIKYAKYKWEFLRRNSKYIEEWEDLQKFLEKEYGDWRPPTGEMVREEIDFCKRWKIMAISPYMGYDDLINEANSLEGNRIKNLDTILQRTFFCWLYPEHLPGRPLFVLSIGEDGNPLEISPLDDELANSGTISVEIDLQYSKSRLVKEFNMLLDEYQALYEDAYKRKLVKSYCGEKGISRMQFEQESKNEFEKYYKKKLNEKRKLYDSKYHFDNFDAYLKVYDLRKEGISWSKITSMLDLNSIQTARNHYKSACEIIKKGIELYVKKHY